eukprot:bmy_17648T0
MALRTANISIPLNALTTMSRRHNIITVHHGNPNNPKLTLHLSQHNSNHLIGVHRLRSHTQVILASNSIKYSVSPAQRITELKKTIHHYTNHITNIFNHNIYHHRSNSILHYIRGHTSSYTHHHHSMCRITSTASGISIYPKHHGLSEFPSTPILNPSITQLLIQRLYMTSLHNSLYAHVEAPIAGSIVLEAVLLKRGGYSILRITAILNPLTEFFNLSTPDRPKITYRIFFCQLHSTCYCSYSHPDSLKYIGATALIIAHGLTSSILFCLANSNYERDSSYPLVLGAKKLVQLQVKVINLFSSFALVTLLILIIPIIITNTDFYKSNKYPSYVKNTVSYAFITSLVPTIIFCHTGQEIIISN